MRPAFAIAILVVLGPLGHAVAQPKQPSPFTETGRTKRPFHKPAAANAAAAPWNAFLRWRLRLNHRPADPYTYAQRKPEVQRSSA